MEHNMDMQKLKEVELEILIEFDRLCRKNNINYQLFAGSLLGAVRHGGFIPWDDDIDVCMLRKDYDEFIEVAKNNLDDKYFLQHYDIDKESMYNFLRIRKNNTLLLQKSWPELDIHKGIFIDVFPMDNIMPGKIRGKIQYYMLLLFKRIKPLKIERLVRAYDGNFIRKFFRLSIYNILKPFSINKLNKIETKMACMFNKKDLEYTSCLTDSNIKNVYDEFMISKYDLYNTIDMEFEGQLFPVPKNYHKILTRNYGDYMKLPSEEEQRPHHGILEISFDTGSMK